MNQKVLFKIETINPAETESFAESLGSQLRGGEIIELIGDVGAGKTTFVRGLARGAGSSDRVSSPTFTVSKVYSGNSLSIYHYDFYRLSDFQIIQNELAETVTNNKNVVVLEWAEAVQDVLSEDHIKVNFHFSGEEARVLSCTLPAKYNYIKLVR